MELVLSTSSLTALGGSETYAITVADQLQRLGHEVWLHALDHGSATTMAEDLGVRVCSSEAELPDQPDALLVQDGVVSCQLAARYPLVPQVFIAHSDIFDLQLPPQLPDLVAVVVTLYDRVDRRIRALAMPVKIARLSQPIDVDRFKPTQPLRAQPKVALALGNYVHGPRIAMLTKACERHGIELRHAGGHASTGQRPATPVINEADIVFGKARVIYEAMACGRAAYVFDHNGGDGWVTRSNFDALSADNFGGQSGAAVDLEQVTADLAEYDPQMGVVNRDLVVANNAATKHAAALVEIIDGVASRTAPVGGPLRELARQVRLYHRADIQAFVLHAETARLAGRVHELETEVWRMRQVEGELERSRAEAQAARAEAEAARADAAARAVEAAEAGAEAEAHAADAREAWGRYHGLAATRRWRFVQALLSPVDRLRARRR